ncbi:MAG: hypothetical protein JWO15_1275 [Sphingomonadales bacterium]|nr:hypothetical protein [Sphingomonadales bacterium]
MAIAELNVEELGPGVLAAEFAKGAVAATIRCPETSRSLWSDLMENSEERLPWEAPLIDMARNHHGTDDITLTLGDAFYFQPEQHAYIARKMELRRCAPGGMLEVYPKTFVQGESIFTPHARTVSSCWSIAERIMLAVIPKEAATTEFKVAVQRLKYQASWADFGKLMGMTEHSLGRWGRLGYAVDRSRQRTAGFLARKGPSDALGMLMLLPLIGKLIAGLNDVVARNDAVHRLEEGHHILEKAHYDDRFFSGLCGKRDAIVTEVFSEGKWIELPVNLDCIAVFPGRLASRDFGLSATLHRVLHTGKSIDDGQGDARSSNVTILLGTT